MSNFEKLVLGLLVFNALVLDIGLMVTKRQPIEEESKMVETKPAVVQEEDMFKTRIETSPAVTEAPEPTSNPGPVSNKNRYVSYVPIPGSGSSQSNSWVNIRGTEFFLNTEDYPDLEEAYFEANIRLFNGNGKAYVRLMDVTSGIEVWGSEMESSSQDFSAVASEKLTLRSGPRMYRVQVRSLTADTTVYNSGRLKIISR